jgi:hypothetical protein
MNEILRRSCSTNSLIFSINGRLGQGADLLEKRWWDDRPDGLSFVSYSAANVGQDKDSEKRQRLAIERYAKQAGFDVVE